MTDCKHVWKELDGIYALTKIQRQGAQVVFMPDQGVPVIVQYCENCGELKLYSAIKKGKF